MWITRWSRTSTTLLFVLLIHFRHSYSQEDYYRRFPSAVPKFLPVPENITVHEGETAYMRCRIHNLGPKLVVWRKANEVSPLTTGKMVFTPNKNVEIETEEISEDENRWDLVIKNVSQDQAGIYSCQVAATNNYTLNITLNVLDPIEHKPELELTGTAFPSLMDDIVLTCNATGSTSAPDAVDWFIKGQPISVVPSGGRVVELNQKPVPGRSLISQLIVKKATLNDTGNYVCRLTTKLARVFKVNVLNDTKSAAVNKRGDPPKEVQRAAPSSSDKSYAPVNCASPYVSLMLIVACAMRLRDR